MIVNKEWTLASRPAPGISQDNFRLVETAVPAPGPGEVLVKNHWLSVDPYMRGRMSAARSYARHLEIGEVMVGDTVGEVVESRAEGLAEGDRVLTPLGWRLFGCATPGQLVKLDDSRAPLSYHLGLLGMPGMTAYFGMREIARAKPGETVVVSAASGAVGSVVGQLAKAAGCRAVGIAGSGEKCDYAVHELGFDACVDYKAGDLGGELTRVCPAGVDVYFDNVGGPILDTVLSAMNRSSRLVVCGVISGYDAAEPYGVRNWRSILVNRIQVQGMIVLDWRERYPEALSALTDLYTQGRLRTRESVVDGIERAPEALMALFEGKNFGKQLVRLV